MARGDPSKSTTIRNLYQRADELEQALAEQRRLARELEKRNTELSRLSELKDTFVGIVSHDLRSPLTNIKGYAELLKQDVLGATNPEQQNSLAIVLRNCTHLLDVLDKLLDINQIESGNFELNLCTTNLVPIAQERLASFRLQAEEKGIDLHGEFTAEVHPVRCDPERLASVIDNLLSNAVKFCRAGDSVTLRVANNGDAAVVVVVEDTGPGVPIKEQHKLFQRFARISVRPTAGEKTIGLGLSIVRDIIRLHGGKVNVITKPGVGSTFLLTLPNAKV